MLGSIVRSLRLRQWVKNGVVFAPLVFSGRLIDPASFAQAGISALCFCLASSGAYLLNDLLDRRLDRFHPLKKNRPIASGALPVPWAVALLAGVDGASLALSARVSSGLSVVILTYMLLNVAYSSWLKRIVLLDVVTLAAGFVLRVWGGAVALGLFPSHWLQLSVFFLALFLGLEKRRQELTILRHAKALQHRRVLSEYPTVFIDQLTAILTAVTIVCYALYTVSPEVVARAGKFGFVSTVPFVVYGTFRYLYLVHVRRQALDPTEALFTDQPMQLSLGLWVVAVLCLLYR